MAQSSFKRSSKKEKKRIYFIGELIAYHMSEIYGNHLGKFDSLDNTAANGNVENGKQCYAFRVLQKMK